MFLVLSYLQKASLDEIAGILHLNRYDIQNALETLQGFSMTTTESALPGGAIFQISSTLALVAGLVEGRVADWKELSRENCRKHLATAKNYGPFVGTAVRRTIARF